MAQLANAPFPMTCNDSGKDKIGVDNVVDDDDTDEGDGTREPNELNCLQPLNAFSPM